MNLTKIVLTLALIAAPLTASALTVKAVATNAAAWNMVNTANTVTLPNGASWTSAPILMPDPAFQQIYPCISFCSPFDPYVFGTNQSIGATPLAGWQNLPFWATWQDPSGANVNVLSFAKAQSSMSLLWGSLDTGNLIELVLNGIVVGSVGGGGIPGVTVQNPGRGAALVSIFNTTFDELRFSSTSGGFEFSNVTASPVPLPLPLAALTSALGLMGLMKRRRRQI